MNIIIFGPQGCGKGTQADIISKAYELYHLSMGDELRAEAKKSTLLGKRIKSIMNTGALVPDSISAKLLLKAAHSKAHQGVIFDGYPRRKTQLDFLIKHFKIDLALEISVPEKESIKRIASRRVCTKCGANYNIIWLKPKKIGICDKCGSSLSQRDDDKPAEIKRRLKIYHKDTLPLREYYASRGILHEIDGTKSIKKVSSDIHKILKNVC